MGTTRDIWGDWLPVLAERYRLVRFDTRGFGDSAAAAPRDGTWSLDLLADDALAIADAAGAATFHLVGESLGGTVGMYLATRNADRLASLTICSASHRGASIERVGEWRRFVGARGMATWSATMMEHRFAPGAIDPARHEWFERAQATCSADVTLDVADMLIGADLAPRLPSIRTPMLILAPAASPFVPVEVAREIHALVPGSEIQVFAGVKHGLAFSHGRQCAAALAAFLARV
ncbi:MAG: alpha/beta fold hydrolase [Candidatus Rokubacteria bacterium]|nr:alpha/beta fold hydrolase [Candidatus Rokubacteria bacterium]